MRNWVLIAGVCALLAAAAPAAHADLVLTLDDLATPGIDVILVDNAPGDIAGLAGIISYNSFINGAVGAFEIQITTGTSKPFLENTDEVAKMKLSNMSITTTMGGTLRISLTDTDFDLEPSPSGHSKLLGEIGGVVSFGGVVTGSTSYDALNREFGATTTVGTGPHTGAFSDTFFAYPIPYGGGAFSLTQTVLVSLPAAASMSLDFDTTFLPEPSTASLLALGAVVFVGRRRRRNTR